MAKVILIAFLGLILLVPAFMIQNLIRERQDTRAEAVEEISAKWGAEQTITGPVLTVPYRTVRADSTGRVMTGPLGYAHFLPDTLRIDGMLAPEIRYRGIYEAVLYTARLKISGSFKPTFEEWDIRPEDLIWKDATISLGIPDMRGIRESIGLSWDGASRSFQPGVHPVSLFTSGVSAMLPDSLQDSVHSFDIDLSLNGSRAINFLPLGRETSVRIGSPWDSPSFVGAFLPTDRTISPGGFSATWKVLDMNRNYPQKWRGDAPDVAGSAFGVSLMVPVDTYQQSMRSVKYAGLFIGLTFLSFFLIEMINRLRLHPMQYLLAGSALVLFYLLLLSLSEYLDFGISYAMASIATVMLVTFYIAGALHRVRIAGLMLGVLAILYGYLYVLLQMEDYSLLLGSLGLFLILAVVMFITRKLDWYSVGSRPTGATAADQPITPEIGATSGRTDLGSSMPPTGSSDVGEQSDSK